VAVAIIINPISGGARPDAARTRAELASAITLRHGDPAEVFVTERPGHARQLAAVAASRGARLVLAWGGDGTINEVACALAYHDVPLGIVPAGSGNGLARELGVALRADVAIAEALSAEPRRIDIGDLDGRLFVNIAGIGFDAHVAAEFNDRANGRRGLASYLAITLRALQSYAPAEYRITAGEFGTVATALLVTVANSAQFGNGVRIAPGARVDDGQLDLVIVEETSRWRTISQMPRLLNGTIDRMAGCSIRRIERATIECDRPMMFHVDGEPVQGGTSLRARVHPGALLVAVR
jgi:YegS/Rv2252/BmrU family lipid kinase